MNRNYFILPNKIFEEGLSPIEFVVYSFLVKSKDKKNQSFWSISNMADYCGVCDATCRKTLYTLQDKGYVNISKRFLDNAQQTNLYTVNKI